MKAKKTLKMNNNTEVPNRIITYVCEEQQDMFS